MKVKQPILLAILDGWGIAPASEGNAVTNANMEFVEQLKREYPWVAANASGRWVGLPDGQMGNSEVGHIHLGAGRINPESLLKLDLAVEDGSIGTNQEIVNAFNFVKKNDSTLHLMGLFSDGGVHSHMNHMLAIYQAAVKFGLNEIKFDLITDGRDTEPKVATKFVQQLVDLIAKLKVGEIASISGRYYAMDRDKRFERLKVAYDAIVSHRDVKTFTDPIAYLESEYNNGHDDEMIDPAYNEQTGAGLSANDAMIFTNFRPDRAIQMASIMTNHDYLGWKDPAFKDEEFLGDKIYFVSMMKYADSVGSKHIAYPPHPLTNTLGSYLADQGYKQLRIAETEKNAHVTFFFDGWKENKKNGLAKPNEISLKNASLDLIASPKVATYDLKPEMSAVEITDKLIEEVKKKEFDLIVLNFANGDMVGHTGNLDATIKAVKTLDAQLERIYDVFVKELNGIMIITADHGNAEIMIDENGGPDKKHTTDLVPIIITDKDITLRKDDVGIVNVGPTILELMGIEIPAEMSSPSLIEKNNEKNS